MSLRSALAALALCCAALSPAREASAQACHAPALDAGEVGSALRRPLQVRVAVAASAATYSTARYTGEYQGLHPSLSLDARYVRATVNLPVYRIVRNGLRDAGIGDLGIDVRAPIVRGESLGVTAGVEFALTAPTGDRDKELGMGHTMLMPGLFATYEQRGLLVVLQLAYGRAVGESDGMHTHHGPLPLVNPMNMSEVEHALSASYALKDWLRVTSRLYGATPLFNVDGRARELVAVGALTQILTIDVSLELHLPLVGDTFQHKTVLAAGARF